MLVFLDWGNLCLFVNILLISVRLCNLCIFVDMCEIIFDYVSVDFVFVVLICVYIVRVVVELIFVLYFYFLDVFFFDSLKILGFKFDWDMFLFWYKFIIIRNDGKFFF